MCMSIKNTILSKSNYISKQFKNANLLNKINSNKKLKIPQTPPDCDTVKLSSKDKKLMAKMDFSYKASSGLDYKDSIFGSGRVYMSFLRTISRCFSSMFNKKVSYEDAVDKMNAYQKLSYIKDPKEFCQKAFEQVKSDFGYKNIDIPLKFENRTELNANQNASWNFADCFMTLYNDFSQKMDGNRKAEIIEYLIHEFKHVKQTEMSYRTSPEKYMDAMSENYQRRIVGNLLEQPKESQEVMAQSTGQSLEDFQKMLKELGLKEKVDYTMVLDGKKYSLNREKVKACLDKTFGNLKPYRKGTAGYQRGLHFIEGTKSYIPASIDAEKYKKGILEKDAFKTKHKWESILDLTG